MPNKDDITLKPWLYSIKTVGKKRKRQIGSVSTADGQPVLTDVRSYGPNDDLRNKLRLIAIAPRLKASLAYALGALQGHASFDRGLAIKRLREVLIDMDK